MQITIDDQLVEQASRLLGPQEPSQIVDLALRALIESRQASVAKPNVLDLVGKVHIDPDYDYKSLRAGQ